MCALKTPHTVAVIGGGVIGVSAAVQLLRRGARVTLITDGQPGSGASGRSLSWLNSAAERSLPYHALRMAGIDRYRTLYAQDPSRDWLRFDGGLHWSADDDEATRARHAYEVAHGYDSQLLSAQSVADVDPQVNSEAVTGPAIFNPGEGWVSLPDLIAFLLAEFHQRGGQLVAEAGLASVLTDAAGHATGVTTGHAGEFSADAVLVACGPQTPAVVAPLGVVIEDASPLSMLVLTEPLTQPFKRVLNTSRAAVRPNPGQTLALDHDWYEAQILPDGTGGYTIDAAVVDQLAGEASRLIAGTPALKAASWKLGLKPIPGDGDPVFGPLQKVPGCFVAFTHSGATLALIAGELLAGEILTGEPHPMLATFRPERFAVQR